MPYLAATAPIPRNCQTHILRKSAFDLSEQRKRNSGVVSCAMLISYRLEMEERLLRGGDSDAHHKASVCVLWRLGCFCFATPCVERHAHLAEQVRLTTRGILFPIVAVRGADVVSLVCA